VVARRYWRGAKPGLSARDLSIARPMDRTRRVRAPTDVLVALAAEAHGVEPGRIAKTLSFRLSDGRVILVVASGERSWPP
jgi:prolyl-tRNA editing enzyme YbaK/EbsC (Cys-tRNA(Pro) deacylase)